MSPKGSGLTEAGLIRSSGKSAWVSGCKLCDLMQTLWTCCSGPSPHSFWPSTFKAKAEPFLPIHRHLLKSPSFFRHHPGVHCTGREGRKIWNFLQAPPNTFQNIIIEALLCCPVSVNAMLMCFKSHFSEG